MELLIAIIGSVLLPIIFALYQVHVSSRKNTVKVEGRFSTIESSVLLIEQKIVVLERDVSEIQKLNEKIEKIQSDLVRVITLLEERTKGP